MNEQQFKELYQIEWRIDPRQERLQQLAAKYHEECEQYDKLVCKGVCPYSGCAMPTDAWESQKISFNALKVLEEIYTEALKEGFIKQDVRVAISSYRA